MYGYTAFTDLYQKRLETGLTEKLTEDEKVAWVRTNDWGLKLHLMSVLGAVDFPTGTGVAFVVPVARVISTKSAEFGDDVTSKDANGTDLTEKTDQGIGDIEFRVRQNLLAPFSITNRYIPRITIAAGLAAPTGNFLGKEGGGGSTDSSRYVSLGRGLWWGLLDVDIFGTILDRMGYIVQVATRMPLGALENKEDGWYFQWGSEARVNAGLTGILWPGVLNASLTAELQVRGTGKERLIDGLPIEDFPNGGGKTWTLTPTLQGIIGKGFSASVNARIPLSYEVNGVQPVPGLGVFAALQYSWAPKPPPPKPGLSKGENAKTELLKALVVPGKYTIVDYWATWCVPCKKLAPKLEAYADSRDDVVLRKVDATEWGAEMMRKHLPAVAGLPVVDIFGPDGKLMERIVGPECFKFKSRIPAPAAPAAK